MNGPDPTATEGVPIRWGADGLAPAVAQDEANGTVLMVAFMNAESLAATRETGFAHYWSRSRGRLWRKGETSGNEQEVVSIAVNCEQNSLLLTVRQRGAVCHDGYPTCYYRRLEPDGSFATVRDRAFDPETVYRPDAAPPRVEASLTESTRAQWIAYAVLRDTDLEAVSATSRRLRSGADPASSRVSDELGELAGVLDGSHGHDDPESDTLLEASQVLYWLTLAALWNGLGWDEVRPDTALHPPGPISNPQAIAAQLRTLANAWRDDGHDLFDRIRTSIEAVAVACLAMGVQPAAVVARDVDALRQKPYLANAFPDAPTEGGE